MTRQELAEEIRVVKRAKKLTWRQIAGFISEGSPIVATAALLGQMRLMPEEADKAAELLELSPEERACLTRFLTVVAGVGAAE